MKYLIPLFLFITACAHTETKSQFIVVDYLNCQPIKKLYYKDEIAQINSFWYDSEECAVNYKGVFIRKDLIIAFGRRASIVLNKINENDSSPRAQLKVESIDRVHCVIEFKSGKPKDISMTCEDLEKELEK